MEAIFGSASRGIFANFAGVIDVVVTIEKCSSGKGLVKTGT